VAALACTEFAKKIPGITKQIAQTLSLSQSGDPLMLALRPDRLRKPQNVFSRSEKGAGNF
jgi:hypothetical protein